MSAAFLSPLRVEKRHDDRWMLIDPLTYRSELVGVGTLVVPDGFETDFCSVPRVAGLYSIFGNVGHEAGALHDWLYAEGLFTRAICDSVLREALTACGVPTWKAGMMYEAVRDWGASHYTGAPDPEPVAIPSTSPEA